MSSSCVLGRDSGGTNAAVSDVRLSVMDVSEEIGFVRRSSGLSGGRPMDGWGRVVYAGPRCAMHDVIRGNVD